jgi:RNA polymerase primary sigma factor
MREIRLKDFQVDKIVDRLKELAQQVKKGLAEIDACEKELDQPHREIKRLLRRMRKSDEDGRQISQELNVPIDTLLVVEKAFEKRAA